MSLRAPRYCRPEAFRALVDLRHRIEEPDVLWKGACAIAMHEHPDTSISLVEERLEDLARRIQSRVQSGQPQALLAHGHDVLFQEEGFRGNTEDYYETANSYLPLVLERKLGIPITLSMVYKVVMEGAGLSVEGISAPGHFLVGVNVGPEFMFVDPFHEGRVLNREEVFERVESAIQSAVPRSDQLLPRARHRDWLGRMIRNLQVIFEREGRSDDHAAMAELAEVLETAPE